MEFGSCCPGAAPADGYHCMYFTSSSTFSWCVVRFTLPRLMNASCANMADCEPPAPPRKGALSSQPCATCTPTRCTGVLASLKNMDSGVASMGALWLMISCSPEIQFSMLSANGTLYHSED